MSKLIKRLTFNIPKSWTDADIGFSFWQCVCGCSYVRSDLRGAVPGVECPVCGEDDDTDCLFPVEGPARTLTDEESNVLCGFGAKP